MMERCEGDFETHMSKHRVGGRFHRLVGMLAMDPVVAGRLQDGKQVLVHRKRL